MSSRLCLVEVGLIFDLKCMLGLERNVESVPLLARRSLANSAFPGGAWERGVSLYYNNNTPKIINIPKIIASA
jgi:hypothetical protein